MFYSFNISIPDAIVRQMNGICRQFKKLQLKGSEQNQGSVIFIYSFSYLSLGTIGQQEPCGFEHYWELIFDWLKLILKLI